MSTNLLWALVLFAWKPNQEPDLAGYRLYHGHQPGSYSSSIFIPKPRTNAVSSIFRGSTNFFTLTAVSSNGLESLPTPEIIHYLPPPQLHLSLEISDNLLSWSPVWSTSTPLTLSNHAQFFRLKLNVP